MFLYSTQPYFKLYTMHTKVSQILYVDTINITHSLQCKNLISKINILTQYCILFIVIIRLDIYDFIDTVENGIEMVVWIGQHAPPELVMNVFGVNSQAEINVDNVCSYIGFKD